MESSSVPVAEPDPIVCLADAFSSLRDPRKKKGIRHPLPALLSLVVVGLLCGAENPEQISRFAANHPALLPALGFRPPSQGRVEERRGLIAAPSNDMIARALAMAEGADLNLLLASWLGHLMGRREAAASIDGKALRGQEGYVLSLYSPALGHVLWQEEVRKGENELSALLRILPTLLARLSKVSLFSTDAGFCHKEVARLLVEKKRDYLLQLKAPHTTDVAVAKGAFEQLTRLPPCASTVEKRGARAAGKSSRASSG